MLSTLPPIPPEFKSLAPYLQRAHKLQSTDLVMSYWCAYYAAQIGIILKVKTPACRDFLLTLLNELEHLKNDIGKNDAIDDEAASTAYVENYAWKVFHTADNEDRRGLATRMTAKRFLAAANFFEILKVFEKYDFDSNADKLRYAKWKAADIAKAYREGRKPIPGPPDEDNASALNSMTWDTVALGESGPLTVHGMPSSPSNSMAGLGSEVLTSSHWSTTTIPGTPGTTFDENSHPITSIDSLSHPKSVHFCDTSVQSPAAALVHTSEDSPGPQSVPSTDMRTRSSSATSSPLSRHPTPSSIPLLDSSPPSLPEPPLVLPAPAHHPMSVPISLATPAPLPSFEVTAKTIAKAQKHCRFAISALDYEDVAHARKELLAALAVLGE